MRALTQLEVITTMMTMTMTMMMAMAMTMTMTMAHFFEGPRHLEHLRQRALCSRHHTQRPLTIAFR